MRHHWEADFWMKCQEMPVNGVDVNLDNPTRKFLTNRIAAFFKFGPIKLIYSEKTPNRVKNNQLNEKTTSGFSAKKFMSK
jgi:hypothetical protein